MSRPPRPGSSPGRVLIGISGYVYPRWRGIFYPEGLTQRQELEYASRIFDSIELNGTFYSLRCPADYRRWRDESPGEFIFAVKGGRFITHNLKRALRDGAGELSSRAESWRSAGRPGLSSGSCLARTRSGRTGSLSSCGCCPVTTARPRSWPRGMTIGCRAPRR